VGQSDSLSFPDFPRSELERTVNELVAIAGDVLNSQGRLRELLSATQAVAQELDLATVVRNARLNLLGVL
jgi:hypothetical protein